tara:strand:+ start:4423 stop:5001 length:579 start_codon:yes stop_codon:yes gene_type:complete
MALGTWSNPYGAIGGGNPSTGNLTMFGGAPASTSSNLGGGNMWGAIIGGALSGFGTMMGARSQAAAQRQASADNAWATNQNILANRDTAKFQLASLMGQNRWNERIADKDLERQKGASKWQATELQPLLNRGAIDLAQRQTAFELGPDATKLRQQKNREGLIREAAGKRAAMSGMFGPTFMDEQAFNLGRFT